MSMIDPPFQAASGRTTAAREHVLGMHLSRRRAQGQLNQLIVALSAAFGAWVAATAVGLAIVPRGHLLGLLPGGPLAGLFRFMVHHADVHARDEVGGAR